MVVRAAIANHDLSDLGVAVYERLLHHLVMLEPQASIEQEFKAYVLMRLRKSVGCHAGQVFAILF
jgi:hypothetical protein